MSLEEIWQQIDQKANEQSDLGDMNATYSFNITGEGGGNYGLTFNDGVVSVVEGGIEGADCTIIVNIQNFKNLILGNINSASAFKIGRASCRERVWSSGSAGG